MNDAEWKVRKKGTMTMSIASTVPYSMTAEVGDRFRRLASEWKEQSRYLSNTTAQMAILKPYQRIIGMGWPVVPLILDELQREPDQWFWAAMQCN